MDFSEAMGQFLSQMMGEKTEKKAQVAVLKGDDLLAYKTWKSKTIRVRHEMQALMIKIKAMDADCDSDKAQFWSMVYKNYGISPEGEYSVEKDGRIMKTIKDKSGHGDDCDC